APPNQLHKPLSTRASIQRFETSTGSLAASLSCSVVTASSTNSARSSRRSISQAGSPRSLGGRYLVRKLRKWETNSTAASSSDSDRQFEVACTRSAEIRLA